MPMAGLVYKGDNCQWYFPHSLPFGSWWHVAIMLQSNQITVYYNGRYHQKAHLVGDTSTGWYPDVTKVFLRFVLRRVKGNYSFSKLQLWENKQTPLFLWRQHYEAMETKNKEGYKWCILTHWGGDKMDAVFQAIFSNAIFVMKRYELRLRFHWSLSLKVQSTVFQHWLNNGLASAIKDG